MLKSKLSMVMCVAAASSLMACGGAEGGPIGDSELGDGVPGSVDENAAATPADGEPPQAEASATDDPPTPIYQVTLEPGHSVSWFEVGPGVAVAVEELERDQESILGGAGAGERRSLREQFALVMPDTEMPQQLQAVADQADAIQHLSVEERAELGRQFALERGLEFDAPSEPLLEGSPDAIQAGSADGLILKGSVGAPDSGDDSKYTKSRFIDDSGCHEGGESDPQIRRTRRTGADDAQVNSTWLVHASSASYRGTIKYIVKARLDYIIYNGSWSEVVNVNRQEGTYKQYVIDHNSTWDMDVKSHVREADNNGWHHCLEQILPFT